MELRDIRIANLKALIDEEGSIDSLSARAGYQNPNYFSQLINKHSSFGEKSARKIEVSLGLSEGFLDAPPGAKVGGVLAAHNQAMLTGEPVISDESIVIPLVAHGSMGEGIYIPASHGGALSVATFDLDWLRKSLPSFSNLSNLRLMIGLGDSMRGTYNDGDPLIVDIGINEIKLDAVYALRKSGELFIKRMQRAPDGSFLMISDNPQYPPIPISKSDIHAFNVEARVLMALQSVKL